MKPLNSKKTKGILKLLSQYGYFGKLNYFFFEDDLKYYIVSKEYNVLDLDSLRVKSVGLSIGEIVKDEFILTIEGSQLIGKESSKVLEIEDVRTWLRGLDLDVVSSDGLFIIKSGKDFLGCGRVKDGKLINLVNKSRLLKSKD